MIEDDTIWVVDTGMPNTEALRITSAPLVSAAKPLMRVSTPIGPLAGTDPQRCLRFNWEQRTGFLAVADLDGSPYLHLCENRLYEFLDAAELDRVIRVLGTLGDRLEQVIASEEDAL